MTIERSPLLLPTEDKI